MEKWLICSQRIHTIPNDINTEKNQAQPNALTTQNKQIRTVVEVIMALFISVCRSGIYSSTANKFEHIPVSP